MSIKTTTTTKKSKMLLTIYYRSIFVLFPSSQLLRRVQYLKDICKRITWKFLSPQNLGCSSPTELPVAIHNFSEKYYVAINQVTYHLKKKYFEKFSSLFFPSQLMTSHETWSLGNDAENHFLYYKRWKHLLLVFFVAKHWFLRLSF